MTNVEIVAMEMATLAEQGIEVEELNTFLAWQRQGYKVKKGEKALVETRLWKLRTKKTKKEEEEDPEAKVEGRFFLAKAHLFSEKQVEKREEK